MNTKQKILNEALTLFSEKGYSSVYVGDIADAVGIKAPSLYKHYKNKQEIFDSCVKVFSERMEDIRTCLRLPDTSKADINYQTANMETIIEIAKSLFMFYWQDDVAAKFRKMLMIERYHNPKLNELFEDLFINGAIRHEEKIFCDLIQAKIIKKENPHIIALRFYTPIFYLLQKYDTHPDMIEEANEELTLMVQEFCNTYGIKED
ncbi:TetR/AcrR family transcriptional regulator [Oscillospiraceae bacterium LCP25S3_E10]|nr:TetR/AcrR family transcriptional regulator [Ruminococcus sp.]MDD6448067.1 TetR/AcrR family transcriptional regulator [Ruminococcus sp.]MDY2856929.1 TetR/AcrR family transcriptional regulator [Oscillospiraceae bacterium]